MKLTETEKKLRDEIAKELYIRGIPNEYGPFHEAEEFIKMQRKAHKEDEVDYSAYKGTLTDKGGTS